MTISFENLAWPEPSSLVGFSQNHLIRDAENRDEESLANAMSDPKARYFAFARGQMIVRKTEPAMAMFSKEELAPYQPNFDRVILLGDSGDGPWLAVPCSVDPETLEPPDKPYALRSLLYSSSVSQQETSAAAQASSMLYWHSTNRFCGKCGHASESKIGGFRRDCPNCGHQIFPRTDPVVIMLPVNGDRCVMGRSPHFPEGWYSTLAGFVEAGETIEAAVRRETHEESGIKVGKVRYFASQPWPFPHSLMIGVHCETLSEDILFDGNELEDCRWFSKEEVNLMLREEHPGGFICPPNKAISSALIQAWAFE